jgi:hypothetical protein
MFSTTNANMSLLCHHKHILLLLGLLISLNTFSAGYYVCQDPKTGKKTGQDFPCQSGKEIGNYAPVSPDELKEREESAKEGKRQFERRHPGTYPPEEYMTEEEYAEYKITRKRQEEERRKREEQQAVQEALQRAKQAEQRAIEAERVAHEAQAKATEAEEMAAQRTPIFLPPHHPRPPNMINNCGRGGCR